MATVTLPYDFVRGTRAIADQVDANFSALVDAFAVSLPVPLTVTLGGTGATTPPMALTALGAVAKAGDTMTGLLDSTSSFRSQGSTSPSPASGSGTEVLYDTGAGSGVVQAYNRTASAFLPMVVQGSVMTLSSQGGAFNVTAPNVSFSGNVSLTGSLTVGTPVTIANGGTGGTTAAAAWTNIGIPAASATTPAQVGTAAAGTDTAWARADHIHPATAATPATADNSVAIATTAFVKAQAYLTGNQTVTLSGDIAGSGTTAITTTLPAVNANVGTFQGLTLNAKGQVTAAVNQSYLTTTLAASTYAPIASPTLTGVPLAPTAAPGTSTTQLSTTAFVGAAITAAPNKTITLSGDVTGSGTAAITATVAGLQGRPVASTLPATNQVLQWSGTTWAPTTPVGGTAGQVQYNNASVLGGSSGATFNATSLTAMNVALGTDGTGDIYYRAAGGALTRLGIGTASQVLQVAGGLPAWQTVATGGGTVGSGTGPQIAQYASGTSTVVGGATVSGDATIAAGGALTLATVNANVGTFQGLTLNAKGLVTAAVNQNYAPLASPTFTGTPAAPTATAGTNTTQVATTAFVAASFAPLASPTLTGVPLAPTAAAATNTTQIATTAYVKSQNYLTANQTITLSGDISGSGTAAITTTLATVNSNVGTFQGMTVNAKGQVTAAVNQNYATTAALGGYLPLSGGTLTGALTVNGAVYPTLVTIGNSASAQITLGDQVDTSYWALSSVSSSLHLYHNTLGTLFGWSNNAFWPITDNTFYCGFGGNAFLTVTGYNFYNPSGSEHKTDIEDVPDCLGFLTALKPKRFKLSNAPDDVTHWGFIAQDVAGVMNGHKFGGHAVQNGEQLISYNELTAVLWKAVQELAAEVASLKARVR
jgi:hypothetical protein